jgi:RNA exonuclease 4
MAGSHVTVQASQSFFLQAAAHRTTFPTPCQKVFTMAPVDVTQLSSNWKRLQETLAKEKETSLPKGKAIAHKEKGIPHPSLKRKRPNEPERKTSEKRRIIELPGHKRNKIRMEQSAEQKKLRKSKSTPSINPTNVEGNQDEDIRPSSSHGSHNGPLPEAQVNEGVSPTALAGKYIALDCEMVGFGPTPDNDSQLARVSLVNFHGHQLYDSFVFPQVPVTDYRTHITGITAKTLEEARPFKEVQQDVATLLSGRTLVGHAIKNDMAVLMLSHPKRDIRDTSRHPHFRELSMGRTPSLKKLAREILGLEIQEGHHSSVEDARTTMLLFQKEKEAFEAEHAKTWGRPKKILGLDGEDMGEKGRMKKKKKKAKR